MPKSPKYLVIGSSEAYSGKSAIVLGLAHHLKQRGLDMTYGKPIGTCLNPAPTADYMDEDVEFIAQTLHLTADRIFPTLIPLNEPTIAARLLGENQTSYGQQLQQAIAQAKGDLVLLEGAGTLDEGRLFELSLVQIAAATEAGVVLVSRFHSGLVVESLLAAKQQLGDRLIGVLLNDLMPDQVASATEQVCPFLEKHGIEVLGMLPRNDLLRSVSVAELVHQLDAEILCRADRTGLMVESLKIGAMNVNSALEYFRRARNMAVVTGGDRTDIQLAALESSTQCLILTGRVPPAPQILSRAEELEVPILTVELDTLTTVEIIDHAFGQVRLHEPIKVETICQMMEKHFNFDRLLGKLGLQNSAVA